MDGRKTVDKLPPGVYVRGDQIRIAFQYMGQQCFEPIPVARIDKASIKYAANKRATVLAEIREGKFDYRTHFPGSKNAAKFDGALRDSHHRTVVAGVAMYLTTQKTKKATSTHRNYASKAKHIIAEWPEPVRIADVLPSHIEAFQVKLIERGLSPKTVNDIFTVVRGVWRAAFKDKIIRDNPLEHIENLERDDPDNADPFTLSDLAAIDQARAKFRRPEDIDMMLFACWTGLAESELMALAWEDIDLNAGVMRINRARVDHEYKVPKEKVRVRDVHLIDHALAILRRQKARTYMLPETDIEVTQRDNFTRTKAQVTFVFLNHQPSGRIPWHSSSWFRWCRTIQKTAKIRIRSANQCRHTYASQLISHYVPLEIVARQMGHSDTTMLTKHYGRFIPVDAPNVAPIINQLLQQNAAQTGANSPEILPNSCQGNAKAG